MNKLPERAIFLIARIKEERGKRKVWKAELGEIKKRINEIDRILVEKKINKWTQDKTWGEWLNYCSANNLDCYTNREVIINE